MTVLEHLNLQTYEKYLPTAFDESLTLLQKINKVREYLNLVIDQLNANSNTLTTTLDGFETTLATFQTALDLLDEYVKGEKITNDINAKLEEWLNNGELDTIFNKGIMNAIVPKRVINGGQLKKLKTALQDSLTQLVEIVFIGDSITWGLTVPNNAVSTPRDATLSDVRDNYTSKSFVNEFKRYIMRTYATGNPTLSNWQYSPSGQSTVEIVNNKGLYPFNNSKFTLTKSATGATVLDRESVTSYLGRQTLFGLNSGSTHDIDFTFTGETFDVYFSTANQYSCDYELFVDGVSQGTFGTGTDTGNPVGNKNFRTHTFGYVKNKTIKITIKYHLAGQTNTMYFEGIRIPKTIRIINQGIIGITSDKYKTYNLTNNTFGDGVAVSDKTGFTFVMLGTNDRIIRSGVTVGEAQFKTNLKTMLDVIPNDIVLMCANRVTNEDTTVYSFTMQGVRSVISEVATERTLDMIDHYILFDGLSTTEFTADGLHPNEMGHRMMSRNIINSLEN